MVFVGILGTVLNAIAIYAIVIAAVDPGKYLKMVGEIRNRSRSRHSPWAVAFTLSYLFGLGLLINHAVYGALFWFPYDWGSAPEGDWVTARSSLAATFGFLGAFLGAQFFNDVANQNWKRLEQKRLAELSQRGGPL